VDYYRGLIALRMQLPALQDKTAKAGQRIVSAVELAPNCVGVSLDNAGKSTWDKLVVICNANREAQQAALPGGSWQILVDGESSFRWQTPGTVSGAVRVEPVSVLVLGRTAR
jgi:pullulanase